MLLRKSAVTGNRKRRQLWRANMHAKSNVALGEILFAWHNNNKDKKKSQTWGKTAGEHFMTGYQNLPWLLLAYKQIYFKNLKLKKIFFFFGGLSSF